MKVSKLWNGPWKERLVNLDYVKAVERFLPDIYCIHFSDEKLFVKLTGLEDFEELLRGKNAKEADQVSEKGKTQGCVEEISLYYSRMWWNAQWFYGDGKAVN